MTVRRPVLVAAALVLTTARAQSQVSTHGNLSLEWTAPASCPTGERVLERARSLLAGSPESPEPVKARGVVKSGAAGSWELTLETVHGARTWQRSLRAGSCEELADAGALIIALVVDPALKREPAPSTPPATEANPPSASAAPASPSASASPRPSSATPAASPAPAAPELAPGRVEPERVGQAPFDRRPATESDRRSSVSGHAALSGVADVGSLPNAALGLQVAAGLGLEPVELEILGSFFPKTREVIANGPERGGEISLLTAGARGCYVLDWEALGAGACAGFEAGRMQGTGFGTTGYVDTKSSVFAAARVGAFARYPLVSVSSLRAGVEGVIPVTRPEFWLENVGRVHRPNEAGLRLELGVELVFR